MENPQAYRLSVEPGAWNWAVEAHLAPAVSPPALIAIRDQVASGAAALFILLDDSVAVVRCVGAYVLRIDQCGPIKEGVIVAAGGSVRGVDLVETILPHAEAQFVGVDAIRIHTSRPGLLKKLAKRGYTAPEFIMRKKINAATA